MSSPYGWKAKEVRKLICKRSGTMYSETHVYRLLNKWGFRRKVPLKRSVNSASMEEKEDFKKGFRGNNSQQVRRLHCSCS